MALNGKTNGAYVPPHRAGSGAAKPGTYVPPHRAGSGAATPGAYVPPHRAGSGAATPAAMPSPPTGAASCPASKSTGNKAGAWAPSKKPQVPAAPIDGTGSDTGSPIPIRWGPSEKPQVPASRTAKPSPPAVAAEPAPAAEATPVPAPAAAAAPATTAGIWGPSRKNRTNGRTWTRGVPVDEAQLRASFKPAKDLVDAPPADVSPTASSSSLPSRLPPPPPPPCNSAVSSGCAPPSPLTPTAPPNSPAGSAPASPCRHDPSSYDEHAYARKLVNDAFARVEARLYWKERGIFFPAGTEVADMWTMAIQMQSSSRAALSGCARPAPTKTASILNAAAPAFVPCSAYAYAAAAHAGPSTQPPIARPQPAWPEESRIEEPFYPISITSLVEDSTPLHRAASPAKVDILSLPVSHIFDDDDDSDDDYYTYGGYAMSAEYAQRVIESQPLSNVPFKPLPPVSTRDLSRNIWSTGCPTAYPAVYPN